MAVTERTRHDLHETLVELLGPERAETMMESLPPVGWGDIASGADLDHLEQRLTLRIEALEHRLMGAMEARSRQTTVTMVGMMTTQTGVLVALVLALR